MDKGNGKPHGIKCTCGHVGGVPATAHAGGKHGIPHGFGPCSAKGCRCRAFIPAPKPPKEPSK